MKIMQRSIFYGRGKGRQNEEAASASAALGETSLSEEELEQLIREHETFILRTASAVSRRYITKGDDEWSLALLAFAEAAQAHNPERGSLRTFAELVIRRRLTDHFRKQGNRQELSVDPAVFSAEPSEETADLELRMAVAQKTAHTDDNPLREEIEAVSQELTRYGFSFFDLASCSPKAGKTKESCAQAVNVLLDTPILWEELRRSGQLPMKALQERADVPRKLLDRHRKYIIAAAIILSGEYPGLAEYMRFIRKEPHS